MTARPFPINPVQTALTISFRNDRLGLIADDILPRVPVGASRFSWNYLPVAQGFTVPETEVGRRGTLNRVEFTGEQRDDSVRDFGLESSIPIQDIKDAEAMRNNGLGTFDRNRGSFPGGQAVAAFLTRSGRGVMGTPSGMPRRSPR